MRKRDVIEGELYVIRKRFDMFEAGDMARKILGGVAREQIARLNGYASSPSWYYDAEVVRVVGMKASGTRTPSVLVDHQTRSDLLGEWTAKPDCATEPLECAYLVCLWSEVAELVDAELGQRARAQQATQEFVALAGISSEIMVNQRHDAQLTPDQVVQVMLHLHNYPEANREQIARQLIAHRALPGTFFSSMLSEPSAEETTDLVDAIFA